MRVFRASGSAPSNPHLLRAMAELAAADNDVSRRAYYQAVLTSTFLVPASGPSLPQEDGQSTQAFIMLKDQADHIYLLAFTDYEALASYRPEGCYVAIVPGQLLCGIAAQNNIFSIIVNHKHGTGAHLLRPEITALAEGVLPSRSDSPAVAFTVPNATDRTIEAPAPPSQEMLASVRSALEENGGIARAYLFKSAIGLGVPHLVLGLVASAAQQASGIESLAEHLAGLLKPFLKPDEYVDIGLLDGDLLRAVDEKLAPFFVAGS